MDELIKVFNLCRKDGKLNKQHLQQVKDFIEVLNGKPVYVFEKWNGYGKTINYPNRQYPVFKRFCELLDLKIDWFNDAPKGGKAGDHFIVVKDSRTQEVRKEFVRLIEE